MTTINKLIEKARDWKGYQEKRLMGTRKQLENKTWCPGDKNYTIWAEWFQDYTSLNFQGQAWCAMTVSDLFVMVFGLSEAKLLLGGKLYYNCQDFSERVTLNKTPCIGDVVLFHNGNRYCHTGIVSMVHTNNTFSSIEGNTSGSKGVVPDGGAVVEKVHEITERTKFYHPPFKEPLNKPIPNVYKIGVGKKGLRITADFLNIRTTANGALTGLTYKKGDYVVATAKTFVDGKAWYQTKLGWISARYLEGWVQESNGRWWYVLSGYTYMVNNWMKVEGRWYYFNAAGYIIQNDWVRIGDVWYYLTPDGSMATSSWVKWKKKWYYLDEAGHMVCDSYIYDSKKNIYYWVNEKGVYEK